MLPRDKAGEAEFSPVPRFSACRCFHHLAQAALSIGQKGSCGCRIVRELLSHSDNDPVHAIALKCSSRIPPYGNKAKNEMICPSFFTEKCNWCFAEVVSWPERVTVLPCKNKACPWPSLFVV